MYFLVKTLNRGHIDYNHMDIDYKGYLDHFNILVLFNFWRPSQGYTLNYFKKKKKNIKSVDQHPQKITIRHGMIL